MRWRRGSYAVEFAYVMPLLVCLLAGVVDYGHYFNQQVAVITAVREGARVGVATRIVDDPIAAATNDTIWSIQGALGLQPNVTALYVGSDPDRCMTVSATVPFTPFFGLVPVPTMLSGELTLRMEEQ